MTPGKSRIIADVEGIGPVYGRKLKKIGIRTTGKLLLACRTPADRKRISKETGITENLLLEWANRADLFRIKGVAEEYSDLLEVAGVDTVVELAQRNPGNLYETIIEKSRETGTQIVRRPPGKKQVESWVKQAKKLPRMLEY